MLLVSSSIKPSFVMATSSTPQLPMSRSFHEPLMWMYCAFMPPPTGLGQSSRVTRTSSGVAAFDFALRIGDTMRGAPGCCRTMACVGKTHRNEARTRATPARMFSGVELRR